MLVTGREADLRAAVRSNVFLSAVLLSQRQTQPVRVRNISSVGALVDGADLPVGGDPVTLIRGPLRAEGQVAWRRENQCGLRFTAAIVLDDWVSRVEHAGQRRVDQMISLIRGPQIAGNQRPVLAHKLDTLDFIARDLSELCDRLANLPDFVADQGAELLRLDAISQRLNQLAGNA